MFPKPYADTVARLRVPSGFLLVAAFAFFARPSLPSLAWGVPVSLLGLALRAWAAGHLAKNRELATGGPYAYTRNPLYLGSLILAIGFAWISQSAWILAGVVLMFFAVYLPVISGEEKFLRERFPEFERYSKAVPRMFPRFPPYKKGESKFSWALYAKHREYNALLGSAAVLGVMVERTLHIL